MEAKRTTLFDGATLQIGAFDARPTSHGPGDVEQQNKNVVVLPVSGLFSKHDRPGHEVIGTPGRAVFIPSDTSYRIGFPGGIGDRALILRFDRSLVPEIVDSFRNRDTMSTHGALSRSAILLRGFLWRLLPRNSDHFEAETLGLDLLRLSFSSMRARDSSHGHGTSRRHARAIERVREAVAAAPADKWDIASLARIANLSPFHLCHVFREMTGISVHDHVLRERLAQSLDAVLDGTDLTAVALDAGFASHSHFSARFKRFFGHTPSALRRLASSAHVAELRKIVTAPVMTVA